MTRTWSLNSSTNNNNNNDNNNTIKFLYSYGGKIQPRRSDGQLRYIGGLTRVLAVDRSITYAELMVKFGELCEKSMSLRCKLPSEDLDVLVSVTSDEELASVIEEYDRISSSTNQEMKIRAILFPLSVKKVSPPQSPSAVTDINFSGSNSPQCGATGFYSVRPPTAAMPGYQSGSRNSWPVVGYPVRVQKDAGNFCRYSCCEAERPRQMRCLPQWNQTYRQ